MNKATVIFTCFNRKEKTINCLKTITQYNPNVVFDFIIVDDASTDGTLDEIEKLNLETQIIHGDGSLYWCGGMRRGIDAYLTRHLTETDYCLLINDDVAFFERSIEKMFERLDWRKDTVVVGATCNETGKFTYGLKAREKWYKKNITRRIEPSQEEIQGETCNANCVLMPSLILKDIGNMDPVYRHSLGDYDLGFRMTKKGYKLISSSDYVGVCNDNPVRGTWMDHSLSRMERLKKKESIKGSPANEWWHFLYKNFGFISAVKYTVSPYIKILLNK